MERCECCSPQCWHKQLHSRDDIYLRPILDICIQMWRIEHADSFWGGLVPALDLMSPDRSYSIAMPLICFLRVIAFHVFPLSVIVARVIKRLWRQPTLKAMLRQSMRREFLTTYLMFKPKRRFKACWMPISLMPLDACRE